MESPFTLMATALSALLAGPFATEPSATLNLLPWHGQLMVPPRHVSTMQPGVRADRGEALNWPGVRLGHHDLLVFEDLAAADRDVGGLRRSRHRRRRAAPPSPVALGAPLPVSSGRGPARRRVGAGVAVGRAAREGAR